MLALAVPAAVTAVLVAAADTGHVYLQASAYGDERRFGLRPPLGYLLLTVVSWAIWTAALLAAPLALGGPGVGAGGRRHRWCSQPDPSSCPAAGTS